MNAYLARFLITLFLGLPVSSIAQTGNFFQDLAKGLEDIAKGLESISNPQSADQKPQQKSSQETIPKETVAVKFKNNTGHSITVFKVAKPEDAYFGDNLISQPIANNIDFEYQRDKDACTLNFLVYLSNRMQKQLTKVNVCTAEVINLDSSNLSRTRSTRLSSVASTLQSNMSPNGSLTIAVRLANATPGCSVGDSKRLNIPKSDWSIDFNNNYVLKLRAVNPEKYGLWDIYGVTFVNTWNSANNSSPVALSYLCAE